MLMSVRMSDDGCAFLAQPEVPIGVVKMPMHIDQVGDGIGAEAVRGLQNPRAGTGYAGIDKHLAISAGEDRDISTGSLQDTHAAPQLVYCYLCPGGLSLNTSTMFCASAKACDGVSQPPVAAIPDATVQQRQKPRRDRVCVFGTDI